MTRQTTFTILFSLATTLSTAPAYALINPNFTPIHVVEQSAVIVRVEVPQELDGKQVSLKVVETLKGDSARKSLSLDFSTAKSPEHADACRQLLRASTGASGLLFAGEFIEESELGGGGFGDGFGDGGFGPGPDAAGQQVDAQAFLHVSGRWISLDAGDDGHYGIRQVDDDMEGTWAGGTDMFCRAVRYILTNEDPEVPSVSGVSWGTELKITTLQGKVRAAEPVWLDSQRRPHLFLACDQGDRLFRFDTNEERFIDVTGERGLGSKSEFTAWGDLNGNGRLDLASWERDSLVVHTQTGDGTFRGKTLVPAERIKEPCLGLAVVDGGDAGRVAIVISTPTIPQLLIATADRTAKLRPVAAGEATSNDLGPAGPCLVADFDDDGLPDLLQPFAKGSLFYLGNQESIFAAPVACAVALGEGASAAFLGDYDGDGQFDILTVAEDRPRLWHNLGGGKFVETRGISGEIAYISQPRGTGGMTGDINNDGRQDVLILYSDREPQLFFNRGFRSFGHAHTLDLHDHGLLPASADGQQAGCLAEFSGYGAQDMVLVLANGEVWAMLRDDEYDDGLYVGVSLAPDALLAGPLKVTAEADDRDLGAWNVSPGSSAAFFGRMEAGPCTVKWQVPGGELQKKEVVVESGPVWFSIR